MVFQHFNLFDHLSVLDNVAEAPVTVYGQSPDTARTVALRLLAAVGLAGTPATIRISCRAASSSG